MRFARALNIASLCGLAPLALAGCDEPKGSAPVAEVERATPVSIPDDTDTRDYLSPDESRTAARDNLLPQSTKSVLRIERQMRHGQYEWQDGDVPDGPVTIRVDLKRQLVSAFRDGHEIGTAVVLYGAEGLDTPQGKFPILRKSKEYYSRTYDNAPMPYSLWLTEDGVALHGSKVEWGAATHGCVGVPVGFAEKLFEVTEPGDVVEIVEHKANAA